MNFIRFLFWVTFVGLFFGCRDFSSKEPIYMAFEEVVFVDTFPNESTVDGQTDFEMDIIGLRDFAIWDTLLVLGTSNPNGIWSFHALSDHRFLGSYLKRGEGPGEFMQGPNPSSDSRYIAEEGVAYLYDFQKGGLKMIDIRETILTGQLDLIETDIPVPPFLSSFIMLDSVRFFVKEISNKDTQQLRYLLQNGERVSLPTMDILNQAALFEGSDFNLLAANSKYSHVHNRMVEAPTGLNYINLYSLDGDFSKTICVGDRLSDLVLVQRERPQWNRKYVFVNIQAFDDFFGVIYVNESFKNYQTVRNQLPYILLFDWDGRPLSKWKMTNHFTHFDIDFRSGALYTFDFHSDQFLKFDVRDALTKIQR